MLADGIEVAGAWLDNGLLNIDLVRRAARRARAQGGDPRQSATTGSNGSAT